MLTVVEAFKNAFEIIKKLRQGMSTGFLQVPVDEIEVINAPSSGYITMTSFPARMKSSL